MFPKLVGGRIREARKAAGLSQQQPGDVLFGHTRIVVSENQPRGLVSLA